LTLLPFGWPTYIVFKSASSYTVLEATPKELTSGRFK